jgi:Zn-dependent membrane protease YugP
MNIHINILGIIAGSCAILLGILFGIPQYPLLGLILLFAGVIVFTISILKSTGRYGRIR